MLLNERQSLAVKVAVDGHNLLLTGLAGTGKSIVLSEIHDNLTRSGQQVQLTCSTGIACTVYPSRFNAMTLHQFSGIDDGRHEPSQIISVLLNNPKYEHVVQRIRSTDVLIVDECSMISDRTFHSLQNVCSLKDGNKLFGGMQVIFSGDFYQLPPVPNRRYGDDGSYCFQNANFKQVFPHHIMLSEVMRQNNENFVSVLKQIYTGYLTEDSQAFLSALNRPLVDSCDSVKLFSTNMLVDQHNRNCLLSQQGNMVEFKAVDTGVLKELKTLTVPKILWVKVGCPVILLRNLSNRLVNGMRGRLVGVSSTELSVHFTSLDIMTGIKREKFTVFDPKTNSNIAVREQFPLKPAYALTIHKAQGMTLEWVEVDCRGIFKPGQLGVALSRTKTADRLRIINFHPRCLFKPPIVVREFMNMEEEEIVQDLSCCRLKRSDQSLLQFETVTNHNVETFTELCLSDSDMDDDFNEIISSIEEGEQDTLNFNLPENFHINDLLANIAFKKAVTDSQCKMNSIISSLHEENPRLLTFVKKLFLQLSTFINSLNIAGGKAVCIPENKLAHFFEQVHKYTTSLEYVMLCLVLFNMNLEQSFENEHRIVCYKILEYVREFLIKAKADSFLTSTRQTSKRFVNDASKSRIRYVGGYCLAKLHMKSVQIMQSNMFSNSKSGHIAFDEARKSVEILNVLKEEEHYLKQITTDPDSLLDTDRRQNVNHGLTNLNDDTFQFFIQLTSTCLTQLSQQDLGKSMYNNCLATIHSDKKLFEQFTHVVASHLKTENVQEFSYEHEMLNLDQILNNIVSLSAQMCFVYNELTRKFLMVLFAQFCRDVKSAFKIKKTMAHRKQIRVSKDQEKNISQIPVQERVHSKVCVESSEPVPSVSTLTETDNSDVCKVCKLQTGEEWIQCDSCQSWHHRKCAGLSNVLKWKKFSRTGTQWLCKDCQ